PLEMHRKPANATHVQVVLEQARAIRLAARMTRGSIHGQPEALQESLRPEAALPPLEYVLPHLDQLPGGVTPDCSSHQSRPTQTTLYVWGYGPSQSLLCREFCQESVAAAQFALQLGWELSRPGAWAGELTRPLGLREMLAEVGPQLRRDPAVAGWG